MTRGRGGGGDDEEEEGKGKMKRAFKTSVVIDLFPVAAINRFPPTLLFSLGFSFTRKLAIFDTVRDERVTTTLRELLLTKRAREQKEEEDKEKDEKRIHDEEKKIKKKTEREQESKRVKERER